MRTIIHDLKDIEINFNEEDKIISSIGCNKNCIGCFSCWVKQPKECVLKDEYRNIANYIKDSDEFVIFSKCRYGCYSGEVKKVLERCIGYVLPYFEVRNNEIHHKPRYDSKLKFSVYFYGDVSEEDRKCLEKLVKANAINLNVSSYSIKYIENFEELIECIH